MRNFLAGMAATLLVIAALGAGYLFGGGSFSTGDGDGGDEPAAVEPALRATLLAISETPEATATPTVPPITDVQPTPTSSDIASQTAGSGLPDRTNCDEIYGTQYRSEREKQFFLATCVEGAAGTTGATGATGATAPPAEAPPTEAVAPATNTDSQANNRFTWGGSGGDYIAFSTTLCQSGTVGYTLTGEYTGRSFCTQSRVQGMPPFTCPEGAVAQVQEATSSGTVIGEVFCITPYTPTPAGG
jgi:hypothetical protein